jgi:hypothetical protein
LLVAGRSRPTARRDRDAGLGDGYGGRYFAEVRANYRCYCGAVLAICQ